MFKQLSNIDTAFRHIRLYSIIFLVVNALVCCYALFSAIYAVQDERSKVYVLVNGKVIEAMGVDRRNVLEIEVKDHVRDFHFYFFTANPDEDMIRKNVTKALYLSDGSAKQEYDNLQESGYYTSLVSGNVTQSIAEDSILLNLDARPIEFTYYGKLKMTRTTSILTRSIVTTGRIRTSGEPSDNNAHGFLIEKWRIVANQDIHLQSR